MGSSDSLIFEIEHHRNEELYLFVFHGSNRARLLERLGEMARDPELAFDSFDAAIVAGLVMQTKWGVDHGG